MNSLSLNIPITEVDYTKSIVLISYVSANYNLADITVEAKLTNNTNLNLSKYSNNTNFTVFWRVIEFENIKSLQSGEITTSSTTEVTQTISAINLNKSIIFYTLKINSNSSTAYSNSSYARIINSTSIGARQIDSYTKVFSWYVVEFN